MDSTQLPAKFPIAFASAASPAYIQQVPTNYNSSIPGSFGLDLGSPPETFLAPGAGGTAPLGEYFNGLMNQVTSNIRWIQAGGIFAYDSVYSAEIGGYPKGAILASGIYGAFWKSTAENNTVNPDTGTLTAPAAGWSVLQPGTYPWSQITGAPSFVQHSEFASQLVGVNGYQDTPDGFRRQWMEIPVASAANTLVTVAYPAPFPATSYKPRAVVYDSTLNAGSASNFLVASVISNSLSGCNVVLGQNGGGARNVTLMVDVLGRW